jgi:dTMP kinase
MPERGRLITIEGIDGTGKTTLAGGLERELLARGIEVERLREPGGTPLAERIRALLAEPTLTLGGWTEALLYAAARAELVERALLPALEAGRWVLLDRFVDSSLAYQGAGRGLGIEAVGQLNRIATGGLEPDRTLLLLLEPVAARARARSRGAAPERLEREDARFFARIAAAYEELAAAHPRRIRRLDAAGPPETVLERALEQLVDLLP